MKIHKSLFSLFICFISFQLPSKSFIAEEKPNIVIIMADDLGIESLIPYGGLSTSTPHIDKLASQGMLFTHCFSNPACSPSRAEILTGMYPSDTGFKHVLTYFDDETFLDPGRFDSFANQLKNVGYTTAIAGKWNLSHLEKNNTIDAFGFDEHCLWQMYDSSGVKRSRYYLPYLRINNKVVEEKIKDKFGPDVLADFMVDFIKRNKDRPFLVHYPALIPHVPYVKVPGNSEAEILPDRQQKNGPDCFPEMVNYLDKNVSRLIKAIEESGISDNTLVIFCADNGTDKRVTSVWGNDRIEILGGKMTMTDRGARVPLIVKWPRKIKAGSKSNALVEFADFLPTLCEITGAPAPRQKLRGQSFLPQLQGKKGNKKEWVHIEYLENRQIRSRNWIYTNKDELIRINKLGQPENMPEESGTHLSLRNKFSELLN